MTVWIWLGVGLAMGLLALAAIYGLIWKRAAQDAAADGAPSAAELLRAQMKLAILQDRLEQSTSAFERERADRDRAAQLRLLATEAAYQRQMLAMQPRLHSAPAAETPVQVTIRVESAAAMTEPPPLPSAPVAAVSAPPPRLAAPPLDQPEPATQEPPVAAPAAPSPAAETDPPVPEPVGEAVAPGEPPAGPDETAVPQPLFLAPPAQPQAEPELPPTIELFEPPQGISPAPELAVEALLAQSAVEGAFPVPPGIEARETEDVVLDAAEVARFLAVANGELEDPYDGLEPVPAPQEPSPKQQAVEPAIAVPETLDAVPPVEPVEPLDEEPVHEPDDWPRPVAVAVDEPPSVPDAPLEDLDEIAPVRSARFSAPAPPSIVPPWQDELDADFVDEDDAWPETAARAEQSDAPPQDGPSKQAAPSRWEVLPREESQMANLDYLDSGVFAVPALPGWGQGTAVAQPPVPLEEAPPGAVPAFAATSAPVTVEPLSESELIAPEKPPEPLPQPEDALSWLDEVQDEPRPAAPAAALFADEDSADIDATVARILALAPSTILERTEPRTEEEEERAMVKAILDRGAAAELDDGVVDMAVKNQIMGAAARGTAVQEPPYIWERRPIAWEAAYFDNIKLSGDPVLVRKDREIDFDWGPQAPATGVPAGQFAVRWNGVLVLDPGLYRFVLRAPDGIRLWLNERLVLSAWYDQSPQQYAREFDWQGGSLYVRCEHYEHGPEAHIHFDWERIA